MKRQSVAAGLVQGILRYTEARGAVGEDLLAAAGLDRAGIADRDARVPMAQYQAFIRAAKQAMDDPALILRYPIEVRLEAVSIVGLIVHSAPSMQVAMTQLNRYARLMVEVDVMEQGNRFEVTAGPDGVWFIDNRPDPNTFPEITESAFGRFIGEFRASFPERALAVSAEVTHPAPDYAAAYEEIWQIPVTFGAARNALQIDPYWLGVEFTGTDGYVFGIFSDRADALLAQLEAETSLPARIEALVLPRLHEGEIGVEQVAGELGVSRQTLYRRLKAEGTSFAEILDGLRRRMALDYLTARKVSVNETAYLTGFSEASSFTRAFRRWTGQAPAEYREAQAG